MTRNHHGEHDAELMRIAALIASDLVGKGGYTQNDIKDITQELVLAGLRAMERFVPGRVKRNTFIYHVLRQKAVDLYRYIHRGKRDKENEAFSLDELWEAPGGSEEPLLRGDVISAADTVAENGVVRADRTDLQALHMDLAEALQELPPALQNLCHLHSYLRYEDARETAKLAKASHHRALQKIREFLMEKGFAPGGTKWTGASDK